MKILYISSPAYTDTDVPLLKALADAGNELMYIISVSDKVRSTLISLEETHNEVGIYKWTDYKEFDFISSYIAIDNIFILRRKNRKSLSEAKKVRSLLQNIVNEFNPDVIHQIDLPYFNLLPFLVRNRKRYILTIHDPIPHVGENSWKLNLSRRLVFPVVSKIIVLNEKSRKAFIRKYCLASKKVFVSRLGFLEWMRCFEGPVINEDFILFYGRITPYKGVDFLLKSMETVHSTFPDVKLVVAGSGKFYFDISQYKTCDYIRFINRFIELDELSNLIRNSRFVVCPYTEATQSGVVASVMALNCPIIVTEVGALPDMVDNNVTGLIIPPKDIVSLTNAINKLLSDRHLTESMREAIRTQQSEGKYAWERIALLTEEIYKA